MVRLNIVYYNIMGNNSKKYVICFYTNNDDVIVEKEPYTPLSLKKSFQLILSPKYDFTR